MQLLGLAREIVDTANMKGGGWPAGDNSKHASMERIGNVSDSKNAWKTNNDILVNGHDADGNPIQGTPKSANSVWLQTPTPTYTPSNILTQTSTHTFTPSITPTPTNTPTPFLIPTGTVLINEIAWAGNQASSNDK